MPKPERGSLNVIKRALPNFPPAEPTRELESRLLSGGAAAPALEAENIQRHTVDVQQPDIQQTDVWPEVSTASQPDLPVPATRLVPRPGKRKEPVQMVTYRIPASLYDRLFRTAEYNRLNMTDIVVEAIERHLPNFPQP